MATSYQIPDKLRQIWQSIKEPLQRTAETVDSAAAWPLEDVAGPGLLSSALGATYPDKPEDAFIGGILNLAPGYIAANFRSPEQLQQLRRLMAEEMRSRGPVVSSTKDIIENASATKVYPPIGETGMEFGFSPQKMAEERQFWSRPDTVRYKVGEEVGPDPFDQILRGSWYHGLSDNARRKVAEMVRREDPILAREFGGMLSPDELALRGSNEFGFPISLHDAQSISNKLGEPAGISLSALPTKSQQFAKDHYGNPDEYIHRVLPQYGGPPTERTVNLMTPEGRGILNDAYDVVANQLISPVDFHQIARQFKFSPPSMMSPEYVGKTIQRGLEEGLSAGHSGVGQFNKALSEQLQSQGKRGLLYNPQRWNEYEMLMLDPKYALPVDYRMFQEYANPIVTRVNRKEPYKGGSVGTRSATPGIRKGLSQIEDVMAQNKSRLGDIYSERPWTQRLSEENKRRLLEMIDPQYREVVGNQLFE